MRCPLASPTVGARDRGRRVAGRRPRRPSIAASAVRGRGADGRRIDPALGIFNIDHVIFIVQENRSFDHVLRHVPRRRRHPDRTCALPDPKCHGAARPYHDHERLRSRGPAQRAGLADSRSTRGRWTARSWLFARSVTRAASTRRRPGCEQAIPGPNGTPDVMGYHTAQEIPNYWTYAQRFTLQDRMFAPSDSWTLPAHLYLVSGWSAHVLTTSTRCSVARIRSSPDSTRPTTAGTGCPPTASHGRTSGRTSRGCCTTTV